MMKYEFWSIVPNDSIVQILDLKHEKDKSNAKASWVVGKHSLFETSWIHGTLRSKRGRRHHIPSNGARVPAEYGHNEARKKVDSNVARKDEAIRLIV
jgi:hypothetical protein